MADSFVQADVFQVICIEIAGNIFQVIYNPAQHAQGDFALNAGLVEAEGPSKLTFSGVGIYHPHLFASVEQGQPAKLAPILREAMLRNQVSGEHFDGEWHDIGTPERLSALDMQLSNQLF